MNKNGFTLIELLVVLSIVAIATIGSILAFEQTNADSSKQELKDTYLKVQRAAQVYLDINDSWRNQFNEKGVVFLRISELKSGNYVDSDLYDPTTFEGIPNNYVVITYIDSQNENHISQYTASNTDSTIQTSTRSYDIVDTCIVEMDGSDQKCISNSNGDPCECCKGYYSHFGSGSETLYNQFCVK